MPPQLALALFLVFVGISYSLDRRALPRTSWALWIPFIWVVIIAARPPSVWLNPGATVDVDAGSVEERLIFSTLIGVSILVLMSRGVGLQDFVRHNALLMLFLLYAGISIAWSDLPYVAFKRYIKLIGLVTMVLVVFTERTSTEALKRLVRRASYLLVPASILLIKYYPHLGIRFSYWTGDIEFLGVAESKNMLGQLCLVLGSAMIWLIMDDYRRGESLILNFRRAVDVFVTGLAVHTLYLANSMTSLVCFLIGIAVVIAIRRPALQRHFGKLLVLGFFGVVTLEVTLGIRETITTLLGRDTTPPTPTDIWAELWQLRASLWFGAGYDSFWLGERFRTILATRNINEAHNGYLEVVLNLGLVGLVIQGLVLCVAYRNCGRLLRRGSSEALLFISLFVVILVYNLLESGFKGLGLINFAFFLVAVHAPPPNAMAPIPVIRRVRPATSRVPATRPRDSTPNQRSPKPSHATQVTDRVVKRQGWCVAKASLLGRHGLR